MNLITWILTAILCAILVEVAVRLPFAAVITRLMTTGQKATRVVTAKRVSDHWKERVVPAYAWSLFSASCLLAGLLAVIGALATILVLLFDQVGANTAVFLTSWLGVLFSLVVGTLYFTVKKRYA